MRALTIGRCSSSLALLLSACVGGTSAPDVNVNDVDVALRRHRDAGVVVDASKGTGGSAPDAVIPPAPDASTSPPPDALGVGGVGVDGGSGGNPADAGSSAPPDGSATSTAGWRPFADSSPWNTPIAVDAVVDPGSAQMIQDFASVPGQGSFWINIQDYSVPVYFVDSTVTPLVTVVAGLGGTGFRTGAANDGVATGSGLAPIPSNAMAAAGSDRHLLVVDKKTRMEWGFYNAANSATGWSADEASTQDLAGSGVRPPESVGPWWAGHGPRACGFGLMAGLITADDMRAGRIEHALVIAYPHIRSSTYTPPASTAQGTFGDAQPTRGIVCGGRIQLDPSLDIQTLGLSSSGLVLARALQEYGAFVGDYSGAVSLYADESPDALTYWASGILGNDTASKIPLGRFRVLQLGTIYDNMN
jgi:hypothetical protein